MQKMVPIRGLQTYVLLFVPPEISHSRDLSPDRKKYSSPNQSCNSLNFLYQQPFTVAPRYNGTLHTGNLAVKKRTSGNLYPAPIQIILAIRNFFQNLAITKKKPWILGVRYSEMRLYFLFFLPILKPLAPLPVSYLSTSLPKMGWTLAAIGFLME